MTLERSQAIGVAAEEGKSGSVTRGKALPMERSMMERDAASSIETRLKASPLASARAVRPTRFT